MALGWSWRRWTTLVVVVASVLLALTRDVSSLPLLSAQQRLFLSSLPWTNGRTSTPLQGRPLAGRVVVVTGGNAGIGLETVRQLAAGGATVVLTCRSMAKGEEARQALGDLDVRVVRLDLADLLSVKNFASALPVAKVDWLVLNAGVFVRTGAADGSSQSHIQTADGFELMFGTHHVGHFLLFKILLPFLLKSDDPRLVVTSSALFSRVNTIDWSSLEQQTGLVEAPLLYAQSKLANVLFAAEAHRKYGDRLTVTVNHPGLVRTKILGERSMCEFYPAVFGICFEPEIGAAANVAGCLGERDLINGRFLLPRGAVGEWDVDVPSVNATLAAELWTWTEKAVVRKLKARSV